MALIRRGDVNRPLTIEEVDGNFDYLESLSSGGSGATGPTGPAGATGPSGIGATGATGPAGSTASMNLQQVTSIGATTSNHVNLNGGLSTKNNFSNSIRVKGLDDVDRVTIGTTGILVSDPNLGTLIEINNEGFIDFNNTGYIKKDDDGSGLGGSFYLGSSGGYNSLYFTSVDTVVDNFGTVQVYANTEEGIFLGRSNPFYNNNFSVGYDAISITSYDISATQSNSLEITSMQTTSLKKIVSNNGLDGETDYSSYKIATAYYNDMKQFVFRVTGDGTDFPVNSGCQIYMNPEEGLNIGRFDYDNNATANISFGTDTVYIQSQSATDFSNVVVYSNQVALRGGGSYDAYLKTSNLSTQREFEFPDNDGTLALLSDISGGGSLQSLQDSNLLTATWSFGSMNLGGDYYSLMKEFRFDTSGDDIEFASDRKAGIRSNPEEGTYIISERENGDYIGSVNVDPNGEGVIRARQISADRDTTYFFTPEYITINSNVISGGSGQTNIYMDASTTRTLYLPYNSGVMALFSEITMSNASQGGNTIGLNSGNAIVVNNNVGGWTSFWGAGGGNSIRFRIENPGVTRLSMEGTGFTSTNLSTNSQASINSDGTLLLDNTTSKRAILRQGPSQSATPITIDLPLVSGALPTIGIVAPASATDTGTVGEIRVTSTFIYTCIATNTWVRSVAATW